MASEQNDFTALTRHLGATARKARLSLGLTQAEMAAQLQVSAEFYARIERGQARPSVPVFVRMVAATGLSADTLLGLDQRRGAIVPLPGEEKKPRKFDDLVALLRKARPGVLRLVAQVLREFERAEEVRQSREADRGRSAQQGPDKLQSRGALHVGPEPPDDKDDK